MSNFETAYDYQEARVFGYPQLKSRDKKSERINTLIKELFICHSQRWHPPVREFSILSKLAEVTEPNSSHYLLAVTLLASLLHKWPAFTYDCDHHYLSDVAHKLLLEVPSSWEVAVIVNFNCFLFHYEQCLIKVWKSREEFIKTNSESLKWFPHDVGSLKRECLYNIAKLLNTATFDCMVFSHDIIQCLRAVIIFLGFLEEKNIRKRCLFKLETLLQHLIQKDNKEASHLHHLILLKCGKSQLSCDDGNFEAGFEIAKEALEMCKGFDIQFPESKEDKLIQSKLRFAEIEAKCCLCRASHLIGKVPEAMSLINEITSDDFISTDRIRGSRTSAFALSRFNLMLSYLSSSFPSLHSLNEALSATSNTSMRLELIRPGICQLLKCYEVANSSTCPPNFGVNSENTVCDMLFQFEHIEHLLNCLYRVSYLWLKSGNLRFALLYVSDGIILTRALCLPEKELQFESLMGRLAVMEQNSEKISDEIKVMKDILKFIDDAEKKNGAKRTRLCSNLSNSDKSHDLNAEEKEALSNSSVMEESEDDLPISSVFFNVADVVPSCEDDPSTSPVMKRKNRKLKKSKRLFIHKKACSCRFCVNPFLKSQQCKIALLYSSYLELESCNIEVVECLQEARQFMQSGNEKVDDVTKKSVESKEQVCSSETYLELLAHLALASFKNSDIQSCKSYISQGLEQCEGSTTTSNHCTLPMFYVIAAEILLPQEQLPSLDVSSYLDAMIDLSSKSASVHIAKPVERLADSMNRLKLQSAETKILSEKVNFMKNVGKTPKSKRKTSARTPMKSTRKTSQIPASGAEFTIFDEDCDVDIKLSGDASDKFKTPARPTRSSQRVATRNVIAARKEARLRHRTERGPVYTIDEIEESRPVSRRKRMKDLRKLKSLSESESEDIECPRASACLDSVDVPVLQELDNSIFSPKEESKHSFEKLNCEDALKKAYEVASASCDFLHVKSSACLLSMFYHAAGNLYNSSAYHILSIGVTLRICAHVDLQVCLKSMQRAIKKDIAQVKEKSWKHHFKTVKDMVNRTYPNHVTMSLSDSEKFVEEICNEIPPQWTVCFLSAFGEGQRDVLFVTRLRRGRKPLHLQLEGSMLSILRKKFDVFLSTNIGGMKTRDKSLWWTQRRNTNNLLDGFMKELGKQALTCHRGVLLGTPVEEKCKKELKKCVDAVNDVLCESGGTQMSLCMDFVEIFMYVWKKLSADEKTSAVLRLLHTANLRPNENLVLKVGSAFEAFKNHSRLHRCKRGHVILILDKQLQRYPWESMPILHDHSVSRMPSVDTLIWQLQLNKNTSYATADLQQVSYVINPKGDLMNTQERFSDWFSSIQSWRGVASRVPNKTEWLSFISEHDAFVFCGHGSGSSFMHREVIARRPNRACALLMGCSSGVLNERGVTEPEGMVLAYLMSGSPCVLACLWPVTDKDIDKYLAKCLSEWMVEGSSLTDIVRKAETVCKIPRLNGSACVVYGIPVQSSKSVEGWMSSIPEHFKDIIIS